MSVFAGPKIATDNLLLCLDASNTESYSGTGTTWSDLTGNGYNATLIGSPSHNSSVGFISFNGTSQYATHTTPSFFSGNGNDFTLETWFKMRTLPTVEYGVNGHIWGGQNGNDIVLYLNPADVDGSRLLTVYDDSRYSTDMMSNYRLTADTWVHWISVSDGTNNTVTHYVNGDFDRTGPVTPTTQYVKPWRTPAYIAYDTRWATYSTLDLALLRMYDRKLTASDSKDNFLAARERFGL